MRNFSLLMPSLVTTLGLLACTDGGKEEGGGDTGKANPVTCIEVDRLDGFTVPPAGVAVGFRVRDCDGNAIRPLSDEDIVVINDEKGEPFNASSEGGSISNVGVISDVEMYSVLTLDFSESIFVQGAEEDVVDGALAYIDATLVSPDYPLEHQIAIIAFGGPTEIELIADFTDDPNELQRALSSALSDGSRGTTDLYDAYMEAITLVNAQGTPDAIVDKFVVVMTDGTHEAGGADTLRPQALAARDATDATIYAIGIEGDYDAESLAELATSPDHFIPVDGSANLGAAFEDASERALALAQSNYAVGVCTPVAIDTSSLTLQITVDKATANATVEYSTEGLTGQIAECDPEEVAALMGGRSDDDDTGGDDTGGGDTGGGGGNASPDDGSVCSSITGTAIDGVPTWDGSCDSGDGFRSWKGSCYYLVNADVSWADARSTCRSAGGWLASVGSKQEHDYLRTLTSRPWIGACLDGSDWAWVSGEPWVYENWADGQPSEGSERCAEAFDDGSTAGWNDYVCDEPWMTSGFVCEFE